MLRTTIHPLALGLLALFVCVGCSQEPEVKDGAADNTATESTATDNTATDSTATDSTATDNNGMNAGDQQDRTAENNPAENNPGENGAKPPAEGANQQASDNDAGEDQVAKAVCQLVSIGDSGVTGTIHFTKQGETIEVRGEVTGLSPGKHGFHVHEKGDLSDKKTGKSAGGHFNPTDQPHGRPTDEHRHVGDLGNIVANDDGKAEVKIDDKVIKLNGPHSIVGRAIVVHEKEDTFVQPTGDAGARVAFGKIEAE